MAGHSSRTASFALALLGCAAAAHAEPFSFALTGTLYQAKLSGAPIADGTPFVATALFDTSSPNLLSFIPGSAIYVPSQASITFGGTTYEIAPFSAATPYGVSVAIFDRTSPFPPSPEYGIGLIGNPILDGAGILADYINASPNFTIDQLVTTTFAASDYVGTGEQSGVCTDSVAVCEDPFAYHDNSVEPFLLTSNGVQSSLTFPDQVTLTNASYVNDPSAPPPGVPYPNIIINTVSTVSLTAVPEPSSWLLLGFGLTAVSMMGRVRRG